VTTVLRRVAAFLGVGGGANDAAPVPAPVAPPAKKKRRKAPRTAPLTVSQTRWYLADLEAAIRLADSGDMSKAAKLYAALRRDGTVHGLLSTRTGGLVRMRRKFRGDPEIVAALEGAVNGRTLFDEVFPPSELALLAADGIVLGVGVGEMVKIETVDDLGKVIAERRELRRLNPEWLRYRWDEDAWYYHAQSGTLRIEPGDGRWVLHCPGGKQEPWSHGLWASLGRSFIAKDHAFLHRENYSAKLANPARVAVAPAGSTEAQREGWFRRVMAWGVNTVFGMTPGYDVKLLESNGRGHEVFQAIIATSDREYMIGLVGQIVTVDGGAGFSNADVHATVRADMIEETGDGLAFTLNTQALPAWANAKFGANRCAYVSYDTTPAKNLKAEAESMSAAATAIEDLTRGLAPHGLEPDVSTIAAKLGVPVLGDITGDARPDMSLALPSEDPLEDTAVADLAAKMTQWKVTHCEHGRGNRCPLCGIERVRDFVPGPKGVPQWSVSWRPIGAKPAPAAAPAPAPAALPEAA
jgi:hypothetical protein